jgi:hypothetical protein
MAQGRTVYNALIIPLSAASPPDRPRPEPTPPPGGGSPGAPDQTLPGDLPRPEHPIWLPLPPGAPVDPEWGIDEGTGVPPHPEHPIEPPTQPPPTTGGEHPSHPIVKPGEPTHPIVLPPDQEGGWGPIYIWGGGPGARPPIYVPDPVPPEGERPGIEFKPVWTPATGWVVIGIPQGEHVTPSKKK